MFVTLIQPETAMTAIRGLLRNARWPSCHLDARRDGSARRRFARAVRFDAGRSGVRAEIIGRGWPAATADRLGITVGTARSHLSKIFDKTGVRHQAELVRLLLQK
jgi:DNA-binding NarL/FixJ family response regulator